MRRRAFFGVVAGALAAGAVRLKAGKASDVATVQESFMDGQAASSMDMCDSCDNGEACHWGGVIYTRMDYVYEPVHYYQKRCENYVPKGWPMKVEVDV